MPLYKVVKSCDHSSTCAKGKWMVIYSDTEFVEAPAGGLWLYEAEDDEQAEHLGEFTVGREVWEVEARGFIDPPSREYSLVEDSWEDYWKGTYKPESEWGWWSFSSNIRLAKEVRLKKLVSRKREVR